MTQILHPGIFCMAVEVDAFDSFTRLAMALNSGILASRTVSYIYGQSERANGIRMIPRL